MRRNWSLPVIVTLVILLSGCLDVRVAFSGDEDTIRVLVLEGIKTLEIEDARGAEEATVETHGPGTVIVNGKVEPLPLRFSPDDELIRLNGRPYRGEVEVHWSERGLLVVDELPLEDYLVGIINYEISTKWPEEAVKTQAVVARTYALYRKYKDPDALYHVEGSVIGQVYRGVHTEDDLALKAVSECRGEVLSYDGKLALTVYHSNAGGMTDSAKDVWSRDYPYLKSVSSPFDKDYPRYEWEFTLQASSFKRILNASSLEVGEPVSVSITERTPAGRAKRLVIRDASGAKVEMTGEELRKTVGYDALRSTKFKVLSRKGVFRFTGKGSGHGVGLSQWGAKGMAEKGHSYREILEHYYPGTVLIKAY